MQSIVVELQVHAVQGEELLVLLDDGVLGLYQDLCHLILRKLGERADNRESSDELGDHAEGP